MIVVMKEVDRDLKVGKSFDIDLDEVTTIDDATHVVMNIVYRQTRTGKPTIIKAFPSQPLGDLKAASEAESYTPLLPGFYTVVLFGLAEIDGEFVTVTYRGHPPVHVIA